MSLHWIRGPEDRPIAQAQLLLTLSASSLQSRIDDEDDAMTIYDVPEFGMSELGLRGISINASQLTGMDIDNLEMIRDRADKASCPVLLLVEDTPMQFGDPNPEVQDMIKTRITRLGVAATALGASCLGLGCECSDDDNHFDNAAASLRMAMQLIDRHEVNMLLQSNKGLTASPERLTELIKKVGGFRIGSLPDFRIAHKSGEFVSSLRRLAPYAGAIFATVGKGTKKTGVTPYSLTEGLEAILAVGYQNTICLHHEGPGDPVKTISAARDELMSALNMDDEKS
jgi:hypothetical protein